MEKEIWFPVVGYEGLYEISSFGRVRSLNYNRTGQTKVLRTHTNTRGYLTVDLYKNRKNKTFTIHKLVASAFLPNWFDDEQVNHRDENKENNNVDNLEWCDSKYNTNYGTRNKRISESKTNGKLSKPVLQYTKTGELVKEWPSANEAGRNGFDQGHISACCRGNTRLKTYKGFIWRYKATIEK